MNNHNILINRKKNKHKNETKYLLNERIIQWKNILEIKEIFTSLRSKILYLQKVLKAKASRMSLM